MKISFYILSENKAQDFLGFVCQLTQTAINKSTQSLVVLIEDESLLTSLDKALWSHDATSFIPHQRLVTQDDTDMSNIEPSAPVLLGQHIPENFQGIVLNTTARPVSTFLAATNQAKPSRVLELIRPDEQSTQEGRHKYKAYQQLGYELTHFKV